jgi:putative toxin-antitoxin system antitoxin component (TIGR02293 family)
MILDASKAPQQINVAEVIQAFENQSEVAAFLNISPRTLLRRLETSEFDMGERLKLEMLGLIRDLALQTFTDEAAATRWLKTPRPSFDNKTPLQLLNSVTGYERVKSELMGQVYGMF